MGKFFSQNDTLALRHLLEYLKSEKDINDFGQKVSIELKENEIIIETGKDALSYAFYSCPITEVVGILGGSEMTVNNWVKRFLAEASRDCEQSRDAVTMRFCNPIDLETVKRAIRHGRRFQRRAELETSLGKEF